MPKKKTKAKVVSMNQIAPQIFDMTVQEKDIANAAKAGQFLSLYLKDASRLLPRPISICEIDKKAGTIRMVFRIAGEGTKQISTLTEGDEIEVMGPLGNGFYPAEIRTAVVIGGGIGIPPMLGLAEQLAAQGIEVTAVLGYRNNDTFLAKDFEKVAKVVIATEDGSIGTKGHVIMAMTENDITADMLFACGPTPMLRGVKVFAESNHIPAQISMEEKMACGIGACLACVCKSKEEDDHSHVHNKRVCKDGPVFYIEEIEL